MSFSVKQNVNIVEVFTYKVFEEFLKQNILLTFLYKMRYFRIKFRRWLYFIRGKKINLKDIYVFRLSKRLTLI